MNKKIIGIFICTLLIATIFPVTGNMNLKNIITINNQIMNGKSPYQSTIHINNINSPSDLLFIQLPALPADPMPEGWASASQFGWKCYDDFWDISSPICDIHWWGGIFIVEDNDVYPSDSEDMKFNIVFYENENGKPGRVINSYTNTFQPLFQLELFHPSVH